MRGFALSWFRVPLAVVLAASVGCSSKPPADDSGDYVATLTRERAAKDAAFTNGADSPIAADKRIDLLPLAYFPIDSEYDVAAILKPSENEMTVEMPTSTGTNRKMRLIGTLEFTLKGQPMKLTAFVEADTPNHLFVAFNDLTSGTETYPGGRYIDLTRNATGLFDVDFNRAYHPYCYYNPTYECPYPPRENRLKVPIRAGEKLKHPNT